MQARSTMPAGARPPWLPSRRSGNFLGFAACVAGMAIAMLYFEYYLQLEPCPLCWFQRVAMVLLGLVFLVAALHHPSSWGARIYGLLLALAAGFGSYLAGRHVWVQSQPPGTISCAPDLEYLRETFGLLEAIRRVLVQAGDCAEVQWSLLGLSIPGWTLVAFIVLGLWGVIVNWARD